MDLHLHLDRVHRLMGRSRMVSQACRYVRNQMNCVIGVHLGESASGDSNGEYRLLREVAGACHKFVDVGANVGEWSKQFLAASDATGFAYEPSPRTFALLQERLPNDRVDLRNLAVGDVVGTVAFADEGVGSETSALQDAHIGRHDAQSVLVKETTLDSDFGDGDLLLDFVKVDTEGYDYRVMLGARRLLETGRIGYLQFEYSDAWLSAGASLLCALRFLDRLDYQVWLVRSSGLHPFRYERWGDFYRYSNFIACRAERQGPLLPLIGAPI